MYDEQLATRTVALYLCKVAIAPALVYSAASGSL